MQGSQESDSPYSMQKSGGSIEMEKSPEALGMNINEYADVSTIDPQITTWANFVDDVSSWRRNFEKEKAQRSTAACNGTKIKWGIDAI